MPVPGYDPEDLDDELEEQLDDREIRDRLGEEGFARYQAGESLVELLDSEEIARLVENRES